MFILHLYIIVFFLSDKKINFFLIKNNFILRRPHKLKNRSDFYIRLSIYFVDIIENTNIVYLEILNRNLTLYKIWKIIH